MAHELTHVINRDVMVMTLASFFATLASLIAPVRLFFGGFGGGYGAAAKRRRTSCWSCSSRRSCTRSRSSCCGRSRATASSPPTAAGAVLTGRPSALASALMKISGTMERVPSQDLRQAEGMSAFFILPARTKKSLMNIFADHPPLEQRLAALERLESQLQGAA